MQNEKVIDVLNTLVQINNDRIEGYEAAAKETDEHDLKTLFAEHTITSRKNNQELSTEVIRLGGTPTAATKLTGKFFRIWMDVKAALTGKDRKTILNSCEYGEDVAKATYEKAAEQDSEVLTTAQQAMLNHQLDLLKADHHKVKAMRDSLVEQI